MTSNIEDQNNKKHGAVLIQIWEIENPKLFKGRLFITVQRVWVVEGF